MRLFSNSVHVIAEIQSIKTPFLLWLVWRSQQCLKGPSTWLQGSRVREGLSGRGPGFWEGRGYRTQHPNDIAILQTPGTL